MADKAFSLNIPSVGIPSASSVPNEDEGAFQIPEVGLSEIKESAQDEQDSQIKLPIIGIPSASSVPNEQEEKYVVPLDGKWLPGKSPIHIGKNFSKMTNMRYGTSNSPEGILGMTKINSAAVMDATYFKARAAFHYNKANYPASHILTQAWNTGLTAAQVLVNSTAIPSVGSFTATELWTDSAGAGTGWFSDAPRGDIVYCNKIDNCIWGGAEIPIARFLNFDSAGTFAYDYTDKLTNSKTSDYALLTADAGGGGAGADVALLLHLDNNVTDSSASAHTVTNTGMGFSNTSGQYKWGYSGLFNNSSLTIPNHADFDFSDGTWTIDFWFKLAVSSDCALYHQETDANNYFSILAISNALRIRLCVGGVGTDIASASVGSGDGQWHHLEFSEYGDKWYLFMDGGLICESTYAARPAAYTSTVFIGSNNGAITGVMYLDEYRVSKGCRHTASFSAPTSAYSAVGGSGVVTKVYIQTLRPAQGFKFYLQHANATAATATGSVWNGSSYATLALTDGTTSSGKTLAQTGVISFVSTVGTAKPKYIKGVMAYAYEFSFSGIDADTALYQVTADCPFQPIVDLWDNEYRSLTGAYKYVSDTDLNFEDITLATRTDAYIAADTSSWVSLASFPTTSSLVFCFTEKQTALLLSVPPEKANITANTVVSISYWTGAAWASVGATSDGTAYPGAISLSKIGVADWSNSALVNEQPKSIAGRPPAYCYKVSFNQQLSASCGIYYISGIPAQKTISGYSFSLTAANRLLLGCDNYGKKNRMIISAAGTNCVWNGYDYFEIDFGVEKALTCATSIFAQYASNIFNMVLAFKADETWTLTWTIVNDETIWERFQVSPSIGCQSPQTLKTFSVAFDKNVNQTKTVAIWRGLSGVYVSNGQAPLCVSGDIETVFDPSATVHVNSAMISKETAFVDQHRSEYHWLFASGSSTTLDKEYVLDLVRWQWYETDRTSGKRIQLGVETADTDSNRYAYVFTDDGYMYRAEYGKTFDGEDITATLRTGGQLPVQADLFMKTEIVRANLVVVPKNTDSTITLTHIIDGLISGNPVYTLSAADATHAFKNITQEIWSLPGIFHEFEISATTDDETKSLEVLHFAFYYMKTRDH